MRCLVSAQLRTCVSVRRGTQYQHKQVLSISPRRCPSPLPHFETAIYLFWDVFGVYTAMFYLCQLPDARCVRKLTTSGFSEWELTTSGCSLCTEAHNFRMLGLEVHNFRMLWVEAHNFRQLLCYWSIKLQPARSLMKHKLQVSKWVLKHLTSSFSKCTGAFTESEKFYKKASSSFLIRICHRQPGINIRNRSGENSSWYWVADKRFQHKILLWWRN